MRLPASKAATNAGRTAGPRATRERAIDSHERGTERSEDGRGDEDELREVPLRSSWSSQERRRAWRQARPYRQLPKRILDAYGGNGETGWYRGGRNAAPV